MAQLLAIYTKPADAAAFDAHYFGTHVPLAKMIPGLRRYEVSHGPVMTPEGESPYHLIGRLTFDSVEAIQHAFASPEGLRAAADLPNFAQAGVQLLILDTREV